MVQKAVHSEASSPNSLGRKRNWPEVHGEECRPRTVLSWLLVKWVMGESEEAGRRTLLSHGPENPEEKEIALSWESGNRWPLDQRQNRNRRFSSRPSTGGRSGAVLAVSWERANSNSRLPASGPLHRLPGRLWALLGCGGCCSPARGSTCRPRYRFGLIDSAEQLKDAGGHPRRRVDWGLAPGAAVDGASRRGRCAGSPRSAAVLPRTAGQSPRQCRRTAPPGRWGRRESVPCRRPSSLPGWARDGAPGPPWWTSPSRGTVLWLSSLVEWSQSPVRSSCINPGSVLPSCTCLSALAWWTCRIAMSCRAEAAWPTAL